MHEALSSDPQSLYEVFNLYAEAIRVKETEKKAYATIAQLRTVLLRYLLPAWGKTVSGISKQEKLECLKSITLEQLYESPQVQEQYLAQLDLADGNKRTQRYILRLFLKWCESQHWWKPSAPKAFERKKLSRSARHIRVSHRNARKPYGLKAIYGKEIPTKLQQELNSFYQFRVNPPSEISVRPVKPNSAKKDLSLIDALMGWLHSCEGVAIEDLSLNSLTIDVIHRYKHWLQQTASKSSEPGARSNPNLHMVVLAIQALIAVAKYKHYILNKEMKSYKETPIAEALRLELKLLVQETRCPPSSIDQSKKWLDWTDFLRLVETLRAECEADSFPTSRSLSAIAWKYQRFLMMAFLAYLPLLPPQTVRLLQISTGLEQSHTLNLTEGNSYLYERNGVWWIQLLSKKSDHSVLSLKVPNIQYGEGRSFYQYLELWLYRYSNLNSPIAHEAKTGLRNCSHPQHSYMFSKSNGKFYEKATEFGKLFRNAAYPLTGKVVTPNIIKDMFLDYVNANTLCTKSDKELLDIAQQLAQSTVNTI
jgi:hypothetical protein